MIDYKKLRTPLKIIVAYLIFTLLLYAMGPFKWVTYNPFVFWLLNIAFIVAFIIGWNFGITLKVTDYQFEDSTATSIVSSLKYLTTINFLYEVINAFRRFRLNTFSIGTLIGSIRNGIVDMGGAYREFQSNTDIAGESVLGGTAMTLFNLVWAFFAFNILILGIMYFKKFSLYNKIVLCLTIVLIVVEYIATGTNIGVFRIILIFLVLFSISVAKGSYTFTDKASRKNKRKILILAISSLVIVLVLFDKIMQSRGGILLWESATYNIGGIYLNRDSILFKYMPKGSYMLLIALSSYLSQGYYGMSLTLRLPWKPGYGLGHSLALQNIFGNALKVPHENSYQFRATQFGWQEGQQWHTMYSWFANDVTYVGVAIVMLLIGTVFAIAYKDAIKTNNPFAKLVTYYLVLMTFFIPCNNQLFQSTYVLFAFITALTLWLMSRGDKKIIFTIGGKRLW